MFPNFSVYTRRNTSLCLIILGTILLTSCIATGSDSTTAAESMSTSINTIEDIKRQSPPPTLSLITTWEMGIISATDWHPMRDVVVISGSDTNGVGGIRLYDIQTGDEIWFKESVPGGVTSAPEGELIAITPFYGAYVRILEPDKNSVVFDLESDNCSAGHWLQFDPKGKTIITGLGFGRIDWETIINVWDVQTGTCEQTARRSGMLTFLDVNDNFNYVAMSIYSEDHQVYIQDLGTGNDVCNLPGDFSLFVPSTNQFAVVNAAKLSFYEINSCQPVRDLMIDPPYDGYLTFSPNGEFFAVSNNFLQLWNTNTGEVLDQVQQPEKLFGSRSRPRLLFSPNGDYLLAIYSTLDNNDEKKTIIQIWDLLVNP